jgi:hypothetical protein
VFLLWKKTASRVCVTTRQASVDFSWRESAQTLSSSVFARQGWEGEKSVTASKKKLE